MFWCLNSTTKSIFAVKYSKLNENAECSKLNENAETVAG